ncbi:type II secretion system GspH family protein [Patescibacteria group bacterium]|nr:type II secretion system GspH family protein [Patescibacteria group bacterium]MBU1123551.1 type II secretion system GspH family protein [Patescibacteria group bacterium]MBU1911602.1 type II secretion system GspH family protein [Patescibacteria group bacterium]
MKDSFIRKHNGFTLLELLMVMAIMVILLGIISVKLKPMLRTGLAYDIRRKSDVKQLENALTQAMIDRISPPNNIPSSEANAKWICQYTYKGIDCIDPPLGGIDLSYLVPDYLSDIPVDPIIETDDLSGYKIYKDGSFFYIIAPYLEQLPD